MWPFIWGLLIYLFESREVSVSWGILFYLYVRLVGSHLARAVQQWPNQSEGKWNTCLPGIDNAHGCIWKRNAIYYHRGNRKKKTSGVGLRPRQWCWLKPQVVVLARGWIVWFTLVSSKSSIFKVPCLNLIYALHYGILLITDQISCLPYIIHPRCPFLHSQN